MKKKAHPSPAAKDDEGSRDQADEDDEHAGDPNHSLASENRSRNAFLAEDGGVDSDDPNLSALFAETGVEERLDELGL